MRDCVGITLCAAALLLFGPGQNNAQNQPQPSQQRKRAAITKSAAHGVGKNVAIISPKDVEVPPNISFRDKVLKHQEILVRLFNVIDEANKKQKQAEAANDLHAYKLAEEDITNTDHFLVPYAIGQEQAKELKASGYLLKSDINGKACKGDDCNKEVDPIVALFMIIGDALTKELNKGKDAFGPNNEITKFLKKPLGGEGSELVKIREFILGHDQNGEVAKLVRDPIKRPIEITQDVRDKIIPASRDPIKCTVGHLWGGC